jgi:hypothetical protein
VKEMLLREFKGRYCTIDEIVCFVMRMKPNASRKTIVWNINDLVKKELVSRVGRGVYSFTPKPQFKPCLGRTAKEACDLLSKKFKYLDFTVMDASVLNEYMNLLPFSSVVILETMKSGVEAVLSALRKENMEAYLKNDYPLIEKYLSTPNPIIVKSVLAENPTLPTDGRVHYANLEKTLVDLACDTKVFGQYQGEELINIYRDMTDRYRVNYSQMLKYAGARNKKQEVIHLLSETSEYKKIGALL